MSFLYEFAILGGDLRQYYLARYLMLAGCSIITYLIPTPKQFPELPKASSLEEAVCDAHIVLAPIPMSKNNVDLQASVVQGDLQLSNLLAWLSEGQRIYAGCIPDFFISDCMKKHVFCKDFMKQEEIAQFNSIATAEGTIAEMIQKYSGNLQGAKIVITGFGRCARTLARKLKALDSQVTICVRKAKVQFEAQTEGFATVSFEELADWITNNQIAIIVNTVPAPVFTETILESCPLGTILIDIASLPGGIPNELELKYPISIFHCLGLPGRYCPQASAEKLAEMVLRERKEVAT